MNGADPKSVEAVLKPAAAAPDVKGAAWRAFFTAESPTDFRSQFDALALPAEVKAQLWDLKFGAAAAAVPSPTAAPRNGKPAGYAPHLPEAWQLPALPDVRAPLVNLAGATPEPSEGATGLEKFGRGAMRGAAAGVSSLTSPENVGLIGAMKLAPRFLGRAGAMVAGGAGLFFTFEMARALVESIPEALKAWKVGDYAKLGEIVGQDAVTGLLLGHGARTTRERMPPPEPGRPAGKPIMPAPESRAGAARIRGEQLAGPPPAPMTRDQRRTLSAVPGTGELEPRGMTAEEPGTANLRRIATRLGMRFDDLTPTERASLEQIQHEMNLGALQNITTPPPSWWPTTAREKPPTELPPLPGKPTAIETLPPVPTLREVPAGGAGEALVKTEVTAPPEPAPHPGLFAAEAPPEPPVGVKMMPVAEISVDAPRFQFKTRGIGEKGVSGELREVQNWNEELAGVVSLWHDPANGKNYVVNGHHRLELAERLKVPDLLVRFIQAKDATEARGKGALINIAEGRGSAIDAAKVFRDLKMGPDDLQKEGVSLKGPVSKDALALADLPSDIFDRVWSEDITAQRGVILGEMLRGRPADQRAVLEVVERAENRGKRPTDDQIREMIRLQVGAGAGRTEVQETLFGPEEVQRGALLERARISEYVRRELVQDKRLFGVVSEAKGARKLGEAGNVIRAEENARIALATAQAIELYDKLSTRAGAINDVLTRAADDLAAGGEPDATKRRAYTAIREAIAREVPGAAGAKPGEASTRGTETGDLGRRGEAGAEVALPVQPAAGAPAGQELSRIVPVPGPPFDPAGKFTAQVLEARLVPGEVEGYPVLFANSQAMALLSWAGFQGYSPELHGRTMPHTEAMERLKRIESVYETYSVPSHESYRAEDLLNALRQNRTATQGRPMVLIDTSGRRTPEELQVTAAEEVSHAAQIEATGARFDKHVGYAFYDHPYAMLAATRLREAGYSKVDDATLSMEIGVRLMRPGRYRELGLTAEQAVELAGFYWDTLEARHGPGKVAKITADIYNTFGEAIYDARQAAHGGRRSAGEGRLAPVPTAEAAAGTRGGTAVLAQVKRGAGGEGGGGEAETSTPSLFGEATEQRVAAENAAYQGRLEGDRLTAQFRAPVTREEQLRRLKRAKAKEQPGLFGGPSPEPQGSLFRLRLPPIPGRP